MKPSRPVADGAETTHPLNVRSDAALAYPRDKPLHSLLDEQADRFPDKTALTFESGSLTYRHVREQSNQIARWLTSLGVRPGDRVGVALDRSPDLVTTLLGVWKAGACYVPFDPESPRERVRFMLEDAAAVLLLTTRRYAGYFSDPGDEAVLEDLPELDKANLDARVGPDALAYILYTSGSTGRPKGVMVEHHSLINLLYGLQVLPGIGASDKVLALTTIVFDIAAVELFLPLLVGAEILMVTREIARDGRALLDLIRTRGVTLVQGTPATWKMMVNAGWNERLPIRVIAGGEALSRTLADQLLARSLEVYNLYGPTETTVYSTGVRIRPGKERITIGRPLLNTSVYLLDAFQKPVPDGETGEICIGGEGVARGYLNEASLTAQRFVPDPLSPGHRMYRTGDLGRWTPGGDIEFLGREDQQVKIRGYRIELGEVEHHLLHLDGIREAVVLTREERPGEQQLVAYVVTEEQTLLKARVIAWRQTLKNTLPPYMIPPVYVPVPEMPLSASGKVDRKALLQTPRLNAVGELSRRPPRSPIEKTVTGVWSQVLDVDQLDIDDDFFELGGHSLIAMEMMTMLEERTGKRLPMASLFEAPTIEKLSRLLESEDRLYWGSLVPIKPSGTKPPLYIVHGLGLTVMVFRGLAQHVDPEQPVFGIQARGLNGEEEPLYTIEEIAASYVEDIVAHNPQGPYCLAGYSLGGLIVFEMARQLRAMGREIKLLAVFDTYAGDLQPSDGKLTRLMHKIKRQPFKFLFFLGEFLKTPRTVIDYQWLLLRRRFEKRTAPGQKPPEDTVGKITAAMDAAKAGYHLRVNEADVLELLRVKERIFFLYDPIYLGWKPFVKKGIRISEVPGDHLTFLQPPNDREVARILQRLLDQH
jgi:amino acid adenylation domain-containing protein